MPRPRRFARPLSPSAPPLPAGPLIVFDEVCVLCSGFVQWVIRHDHAAQFRFTSAQGPLGQALYRDLQIDPARIETMLLVAGGGAHGKLDAVMEVAMRLGGPWRAAAMLKVLPAPVGDWLYDAVARNRYRLFGRLKTCWLPSAEVADRVI